MKTIKLFDGKVLDKIGYGTWTIGGRTQPNPQNDERDLTSLRSAIEIGYRHIDTAEFYASGHSEELVGQAVKDSDTPREDFFITTKITPSNLGYESTYQAFERSLDHLGMSYIDLYLIHWPSASMPLGETCRAFNEFLKQGRLRYVGVSNFSVSQMQEAQEYFAAPILTNQTPLSVGKREYVDNGVLAHCQENNILLTAYSPIKDVQSAQMDVLREIGEKHQASPYQVALAWLIRQPNVITIPMSHNPMNQQANFDAVQIELSEEEMDRITGLA